MRRVLAARADDSGTPLGAVAAWLEANPERIVIATFHPLPGEPDLTDLPKAHPERNWVFPKVTGDELVFRLVSSPGTDLKPGAFGIMEPADHCPVVPPQDIDVFLCPGLAFDPRGGRLGRGKGYYDRALSRAGYGALKLGVCFPEQIVPDTFGGELDIRMDEVLAGEVEG
jgi:5-formyltetrahydrofolate cyclo-ligase